MENADQSYMDTNQKETHDNYQNRNRFINQYTTTLIIQKKLHRRAQY